MRNAIDVSTRVSPELSEVMEIMTRDPEWEDAPTLDDVRSFLETDKPLDLLLSDFTHAPDRETLLAEVNTLIEEFGGDAIAVDFVAVKASEELTRVIEAAISGTEVPEAPTLGAVRKAMTGGAVSRLAGEGLIEPDAEMPLLTEIDALIERHGEDALAEDFIRFE